MWVKVSRLGAVQRDTIGNYYNLRTKYGDPIVYWRTEIEAVGREILVKLTRNRRGVREASSTTGSPYDAVIVNRGFLPLVRYSVTDCFL